MKTQNLVIGGGVVGLMTAYMLHKAGQEVTVVDKGTIEDNASFGNAGLLSAFEKYPLSAPGVVGKTMKLMLQGKSPMLFNPTLDANVYRWIWEFIKNANEWRVKKTLALFEKYGEISMEIYKELIEKEGLDFDFHHDGLLMVYTLEESFRERTTGIHDDEKYRVLNAEESREYLPFLNDKISGSLLLKRNAHLDPGLMMRNMKHFLEDAGVGFVLEEEIVDFEFGSQRIIAAVGKKGRYEAENFILSNGADRALARKAGKELMMTPAKGYSVTFEMDEALKPKVAALFGDLFIACTPRRNDVRLTSKLELGSTDPRALEKRIESFVRNLREYTIPFEMRSPRPWAGFRPLPPNDRPLIGRDERHSNLIYATGLGWLGITLGPGVGKIIADLVIRDIPDKKSDDILLFSGFWQG